jgi:hypothetical protein
VFEDTVTGVHAEKNENCGNDVTMKWMKTIMKVCRKSLMVQWIRIGANKILNKLNANEFQKE